MAFSVTCSICGRQFVGIDDSLMGQQAKCKCGEAVTLQPLSDDGSRKIQVVGGASSRKKKSSRKTARATGAAADNPRKRSQAQGKQPSVSKETASNTSRLKVQGKRGPSPEKSSSRPKTGPSGNSSNGSASAMADNQVKSQRQSGIDSQTERPIPATFDSFDIDDILAGGVDTSPLSSKPGRSNSPGRSHSITTALPAQKVGMIGKPENEKQRSPGSLGMVGSVVAGLSGLVAAAVLVMTRFTGFNGTPLGWIGQAFFGAHNGSFGSGEMSDRSVRLFVGAGWWLMLLGILVAIASLFLLARVAIRMITRKRIFAWARPALATLAVVCLFSLMGLLFVQSVHHGELMHGLSDFAGEPLEGLLPDDTTDEPFKEIRDQYKSENQEFLIGVASFALLPLLGFGGSVTSLFFDEQ